MRKWRLRLTVPKSTDEHGQISIHLGGSDTRKISLTKLSIGPETYNVAMDTVDFGANWVSPEVRPEYREAVQHRVAGLDPNRGNIFAAARSKLKPLTYSLFWGESYYLVRHSGCAFATPAALACKPLARVDDWDCTLVVLPHDPDSDVERWVNEHCGMTVARSTRDWAIVYPAPYALGDHGDLHIPMNDHIILALKSSGVGPPGDLACSSGPSQVVVELDNERRHLIAIAGNDRNADKNVHVSWDGAYLATLATRAYPSDASDNAVVILCDGPQGKSSAAFCRDAGLTLLSDVRLRRRSLIGLYGHPAIHGHLRSRLPGTYSWAELTLPILPLSGERSRGKISDELLEQLSGFLHDPTLYIELDFGPFGTFAAAAEQKQTTDLRNAEVRVPEALRARIEWLARLCNAYTDKQNSKLAALNDRSLLIHFGQLRVPTQLLAHRRAIEAQLRDLAARQL